MVTEVMKILPAMDVNYINASAYSSHINKRLPHIEEWRKAEKGENNASSAGLLNENRMNYLRKNRLRKSFDYYCARDLSLTLARGLKFEQLVNHFDTARKAVSIVEKELEKGWTPKASEKTFELGKALVDALVAYLEILQNPVPEDLLKALRQPGLLTPVNEFPPNDLGICGLVGYIWEWNSTKNKKGEHLICGGAWTEEKYDPDKEEWRPPEWRDINLGFRCVCDWDKIGEVKEPEGEVEAEAEAEVEEDE